MKRMSTKELQIAQRAKDHKGEALTNLHQFIDPAFLTSSYHKLNKNSSPGVDGKYWHFHTLDAYFSFTDLHSKFKSGKYKAPQIRRVGKNRAIKTRRILQNFIKFHKNCKK